MILNKCQFVIVKILTSLIALPIIYLADKQLPVGIRLPALIVFAVAVFFIARHLGLRDQAHEKSNK